MVTLSTTSDRSTSNIPEVRRCSYDDCMVCSLVSAPTHMGYHTVHTHTQTDIDCVVVVVDILVGQEKFNVKKTGTVNNMKSREIMLHKKWSTQENLM